MILSGLAKYSMTRSIVREFVTFGLKFFKIRQS